MNDLLSTPIVNLRTDKTMRDYTALVRQDDGTVEQIRILARTYVLAMVRLMDMKIAEESILCITRES